MLFTHLQRLSLYTLLAVLLIAAARPAPAARAQTTPTQATTIDSLAVEMWPDYDQPSMLVLMTGALPADVQLPAAVAVPLPAGAELNAVARFNDSNVLMSDIAYEIIGQRLILTTTSPRFRVEYYAPYQVDGSTHAYEFEWLADVAVTRMTAVVQQPSAAGDMAISPTPVGEAATRNDGLRYYTLPMTNLAAGQPYRVSVSYTVDSPALSAPAAAAPVGQPATAAAPAESGAGLLGGLNPWWVVLLISLFGAVGSLAWYLGSRQAAAAAKSRKPKPARPEKKTTGNSSRSAGTPRQSGAGRFCHSCGTQARAGDTFCRECGTPLKG